MEEFEVNVAFICVGLSTLVFVLVAALALTFFQYRMTDALDEELSIVSSEIGHAITFDDGHPHFKDWQRVVQTDPPRSLLAIQLYDQERRLIDHYGLLSIGALYPRDCEVKEGANQIRLRVSQLTQNGKRVGFLQVGALTKSRDQAVLQLATILGISAPLVLLGLAVSSSVVAKRASQPVRNTIAQLRRFTSDAGHELKTPLSIIKLRLGLLDRKLDAAGIAKTDYDLILANTERMQRVVENLLVIAEADDPGSAEQLVPVRIDELIELKMSEYSLISKERKIDLSSGNLTEATIMGRPEALEMLVGNLLENALNYTEPDGKVLVSLYMAGAYARLEVTDTGIGIPAESVPFVFDRFYRVDKARSRESGGVGLGLSIVKAVAESHEGTATLRSEVGKGSVFTVDFPVVKR